MLEAGLQRSGPVAVLWSLSGAPYSVSHQQTKQETQPELCVCVYVCGAVFPCPSQPVNKPDAALTAQRTKHKSAFHGVNNIHDLGADLSGRTSVGGPQQPDSSAVCVFDGVAH